MGDVRGFSERGSQDLSNDTNVASQLSNFPSVFTSIVHGMYPLTKRYFCSSGYRARKIKTVGPVSKFKATLILCSDRDERNRC